MNDTETSEKISPTYKKYAKCLGKLYWERKKMWNKETGNYDPHYDLVMVTGLGRRWGNGHYIYNLSMIGAPENDWRADYKTECATFVDRLEKKSIVEVDHKNPVAPEIPKKQ